VVLADPLYPHPIVTAERKFRRCVARGEEPQLFGIEPPKLRIEMVRIVDMSTSNAWAVFAGVFGRTRGAPISDMNRPRPKLKCLMLDDAKEAIGYGVRAKRLAMAARVRGGPGSVGPSAPWRLIWPSRSWGRPKRDPGVLSSDFGVGDGVSSVPGGSQPARISITNPTI